MKTKKIFAAIALILSLIILLASCRTPETPPEPSKYTITWVNEGGEVLETDTDVIEGTIPTYNGETPKKNGTSEVVYIFDGWSPEVVPATANVTYTATFREVSVGELPDGTQPIFSTDGKSVKYGFYPQTRVSDATTISALSALTHVSANGWYLYNGEYYAKETATPFSASYKFADGANIVAGVTYWFKCEPIEWRVLTDSDGTYSLLATVLLDTAKYYGSYNDRIDSGATIYANNYAASDIRGYLNANFYNTAFSLCVDCVLSTNVDNSLGGANASINTNDKVYLPTYTDLLNTGYGFSDNAEEKSATREAKVTDYARVRGAWCNTKTDLGTDSLYSGIYWTRTASESYHYTAWCVNSGGYLSEYVVDGAGNTIRPAITITTR